MADEPIMLANASDYFEKVLKPNFEMYWASENFQTLVNVSNSLFHFHEWMLWSHKAALERKAGQTFNDAGALWSWIEASNPAFGYVRDLANNSKRVRIDHRPSTGAHYMANTAGHEPTWDSETTTWDDTRWDAATYKTKDGDKYVAVEGPISALYAYWEGLLGECRASPHYASPSASP